MKIMKTKIRTNLTILALVSVGLINIHANADNKKLANIDAISGKTETLTEETWMTESVIPYSAEAFTNRDANEEIEKFEATQVLAEEATLNLEVPTYSAKAFSDVDVENEIKAFEAK